LYPIEPNIEVELQKRFRPSKNMVRHNWQGVLTSELPVEEFLFSAGGGFLFGAVAGYAIKKVMKIAAAVIGLFVAALAYLSYKGWVDVKLVAMEDASRNTLTNVSEQVIHALNKRATQFASHPSAVAASGLPIAATFGFVPGLMMGIGKG
jgi:uncharacterized membrane protein (Fun14 family)